MAISCIADDETPCQSLVLMVLRMFSNACVLQETYAANLAGIPKARNGKCSM